MEVYEKEKVDKVLNDYHNTIQKHYDGSDYDNGYMRAMQDIIEALFGTEINLP